MLANHPFFKISEHAQIGKGKEQKEKKLTPPMNPLRRPKHTLLLGPRDALAHLAARFLCKLLPLILALLQLLVGP